MEIVQVGIDHRTAPLAVRERIALPGDRVGPAVRSIADEPWANEVLLVSTCNRTEAYAVSTDPDAVELLMRALRRCVPNAPAEDEGVWVRRTGEDAANHLFRVVAGLESAILGETEIQGQVKEAHRVALEAKTVGPLLDRLASLALKAGKRARTDTGLSRGAISHGQAAYEIVRRLFGGLKQRTVLVVGAGEMATRAATALAALPGGTYVVANRTRATADVLAKDLAGATVVGLEEVAERLCAAHVAIFAGGGDPLSRAACQLAAARRRDPLLLLDYGMPRCVDPTVTEIPGVFLYDLEATEALMAQGLAGRREAVADAETILDEELEAFRAWHRTRRAAPTIRSLHAWAEEIRKTELAHLPADAPPPLRDAVDRMTRRIVDRILRRPTARVRQGVEGGDPALPTPDALRNLFGLDDVKTLDEEAASHRASATSLPPTPDATDPDASRDEAS